MALTSPHLDKLSSEIAALAAAAAPSIVTLGHKRASASGFFWRPDIVVTASEAFEAHAADPIEILLHDGSRSTGTVFAHDAGTDIALVRVAAPSAAPGVAAAVAGTPLPHASAPLALGQTVVVAGRTGFGPSASLGIVMVAGGGWRSMRGGELSQRIWLDARMPRSGEGSAVLDTTGALAGMAVFGPRRRVVMIPADTIERVGTELLAHGRIRHGYLGVSVQPVSLAATAGPTAGPTSGRTSGRTSGPTDSVGLMVMGLDDKGPAATGGILRGDIITAVDGAAPRSPRGLARLLPGSTIGTTRRIDLVRAGQSTQVTVTIGDRPHA